MLSFLTIALAQGNIYHVPAPMTAWLWPAMELCGLSLELAAWLFRKKSLLAAGYGLALAGTALERDITLAVGNSVACLAIYLIIKVKVKD